MPERADDTLGRLIAPRSVAIIGASDDPTRIGGRPLAYLLAGGFAGGLYPVNPNRATVQGVPAYPSIAAVPDSVDVAIVALPAANVVSALGDCARHGVKGCIIFSAGFAETGADGAALQSEAVTVARRHGMRLIGPNCLGIFNVAAGFYATFTTTLDRGLPRPGRLSIVSQSGAFGSHLYFLARQRGLGMRYWITTGNEADVQVAEYLHWVADDPETDVILAYTEGVKEAAPLIAGLERARANRKPVVFMKVGRSEIGAAAASSHTAALAGTDAIYDALFRQYGVHRARTTEELIDVAHACSRRLFPTGNRVGLVTMSGGVGALMADEAADRGLEVAPMPDAAQDELKRLLPFAAVRNPVDITAQAFNDLSLVEKNLEIMLRDGDYDALVAFFTSIPGSPAIAEPLLRAMQALRSRFPDRLLLLSALVPEDLRARYEASGLPVFEDPSRAVAAVAALVNFGRSFAREAGPLPAVRKSTVGVPERSSLTEQEAKRLLADAGIPVVEERLASDSAETVAAFRHFGGPVALKVASPDIPHKTEVGGVLLDLRDETSVRRGYDELVERVRRHRPDARIDGVLVSPMIRGGVETIIGVQRDPVFGPAVLFGLGGIFVETLKDVTFRLAPFDELEARAMIQEIRGAAVLRGTRGGEPSDLDALASALSRISCFAAAEADWIESMDVNPFVVLPQGKGAYALDALIVPRSGRGRS
jgi:acyl-CoA synthetase (NDP forming)